MYTFCCCCCCRQTNWKRAETMCYTFIKGKHIQYICMHCYVFVSSLFFSASAFFFGNVNCDTVDWLIALLFFPFFCCCCVIHCLSVLFLIITMHYNFFFSPFFCVIFFFLVSVCFCFLISFLASPNELLLLAFFKHFSRISFLCTILLFFSFYVFLLFSGAYVVVYVVVNMPF